MESDNEQMGKVTLVLTRPAADRLFSGDSELEVKVRHAAAKEIAQKHFKGLVNEEIRELCRTQAKGAFSEEMRSIKNQLDAQSNYLQKDAVGKVTAAVQAFVVDAVGKITKEEFERGWRDYITKLVAREVDAYLRVTIRTQLKEMVQKELSKYKITFTD